MKKLEQFAANIQNNSNNLKKVMLLQAFFRHRLGKYELIYLSQEDYDEIHMSTASCVYGKLYVTRCDEGLRYVVKSRVGLHEGILTSTELPIDIVTINNQATLDKAKQAILDVTTRRKQTHTDTWRYMRTTGSSLVPGRLFYSKEVHNLIHGTLFYRRSLDLPKIEILSQAIQRADWHDPIFDDERVVAYALSLLIRPKPSESSGLSSSTTLEDSNHLSINMLQYQTIVLYRAFVSAITSKQAKKSSKIMAFPLLNEDGSWSTEADTQLLPLMKEGVGSYSLVFDAETLERFRERLYSIPRSEQVFFVCPLAPINLELQGVAFYTIDNDTKMIFLSYTAEEERIIAKYGEVQSAELQFSTHMPSPRGVGVLKTRGIAPALSYPGSLISPFNDKQTVHELVINSENMYYGMLHDVAHRYFLSRAKQPVSRALFGIADYIKLHTGIDMSSEIWKIYDFTFFTSKESMDDNFSQDQFHQFLGKFNGYNVSSLLISLYLSIKPDELKFIRGDYLSDEDLQKELPHELRENIETILRHPCLLELIQDKQQVARFIAYLSLIRNHSWLRNMPLPLFESVLTQIVKSPVFHKVNRADIQSKGYEASDINTIVIRDAHIGIDYQRIKSIASSMCSFETNINFVTVIDESYIYSESIVVKEKDKFMNLLSNQLSKLAMLSIDNDGNIFCHDEKIEINNIERFLCSNNDLKINKNDNEADFAFEVFFSNNNFHDGNNNNALHYLVIYDIKLLRFIIALTACSSASEVVNYLLAVNNAGNSPLDLLIKMEAYEVIRLLFCFEAYRSNPDLMARILPLFVKLKDDEITKLLLVSIYESKLDSIRITQELNEQDLSFEEIYRDLEWRGALNTKLAVSSDGASPSLLIPQLSTLWSSALPDSSPNTSTIPVVHPLVLK